MTSFTRKRSNTLTRQNDRVLPTEVSLQCLTGHGCDHPSEHAAGDHHGQLHDGKAALLY